MLSQLDALLSEKQNGERIHLVVAGGAAMMHLMENRLSSDVDVISEGLTEDLRHTQKRSATSMLG